MANHIRADFFACTRGSLTFAALFAVLAGAGACSSSVGGGGSASTYVGGAEGTACKDEIGEGCLQLPGATQRMKCVDKKWTVLQPCAQGTKCQETVITIGQPARSTECKANPVTTTDVVGGDGVSNKDGTVTGDGTVSGDGTGSGDGTVSGDGTGNNDGTGGSDVISVGDGNGGTDIFQTDIIQTDIKTGDTGGIGALLACAQEACPDQWASCQSDSGCMAVFSCVSACTGDVNSCALTCVQKSGNSNAISMLQCAQSTCATTGKCGNGTCDSGETNASCPGDCPKTGGFCGDSICQSNENPSTCSQDCNLSACCETHGAQCGSVSACGSGSCGVCGSGMNCTSNQCVSLCGNGKCDSGETNSTCPSDCPATTTKYCGNLSCETGETSTSCPIDCPATGCGNGTCSSSENATKCPQDCDTAYTCIMANCQSEYLSCFTLAACQSIVTCVSKCAGSSSCVSACTSAGSSSGKSAYTSIAQCISSNSCFGTSCGNGTCDGNETNLTCPGDCPATTGFCGDGTCDSNESNATCPGDCPATTSDPGCTAKTTPGCGGCSCESAVCASDTYCCATAWDAQCAGECTTKGGTTCP